MAQANKQAIIKEHQKSCNDTGSPEVQIALLTDRIKELTEHFKIHKKDFNGGDSACSKIS